MTQIIRNDPIILAAARAARSERTKANCHAAEIPQVEPGEKTVFILDARGRIQFCSDPAPFASAESNLLGHSITQLVPGLPLREATPGYNIAFTRFSFSGEQWHHHLVKTVSGAVREADVSLKPIPLERGYCLLALISLRVPLGARSAFGAGSRTQPNRGTALKGDLSCSALKNAWT